MAHLLLHSYFQGIVEGVAGVKQAFNRAIGGVERRSTPHGRGEKVPLRSLRRDHNVQVIDFEWLVNSARTYVTHHCRQVRDQFALHIEIPLHDVAAVGVVLDVTPATGRRAEQRSRSFEERPDRKLDGSYIPEKRKCLSFHARKLIDQRQDIEDAEAPAHSRLAVMEWVPGKSHARIEVVKCGIRKQR